MNYKEIIILTIIAVGDIKRDVLKVLNSTVELSGVGTDSFSLLADKVFENKSNINFLYRYHPHTEYVPLIANI